MKDCKICHLGFNPKKKNQVLCGKEDCQQKYKCLVEKNRYIEKNHERKLIEIDGQFWFDRGNQKTKASKVICEICKKEYYIPTYRVNNQRNKHNLCSAICRTTFYKDIFKARIGKNNPNWKGGHYDNNGYFIIGGRKTEHRVLMEEKLGRKLLPTEIVHHKDLNKQNNDINNLEYFENHSEHIKFHNLLTINALNYIKSQNIDKYQDFINGRFE